jgi:hypothetical protein
LPQLPVEGPSRKRNEGHCITLAILSAAGWGPSETTITSRSPRLWRLITLIVRRRVERPTVGTTTEIRVTSTEI